MKHQWTRLLLIGIAIVSLTLSACGGGGSGGGGDSENGSPGNEIVESTGNLGGTPAAPANVDLDEKNIINSNESSNYFKINLLSGETVFFDSIIDSNFDHEWFRRETERCASGGGKFGPIRLSLNGVQLDPPYGGGCSLTNYFKANEDGEYQIVANLFGENGYFFVSVIKDDYILGEQVGVGGKPDNVGVIDFNGDNIVTLSPLHNYYSYTGKAGDKIIIYSYIDYFSDNVSWSHSELCNSYNRWRAPYSYGICWDSNLDGDMVCSCNTNDTITLIEDGTIIINMKYIYNNSGTFNAFRQ